MIHNSVFPTAGISDEELLAEVERLAGSERNATARLVAHLAELDARRLFLGAGFPSLFSYCTKVLCLSEDAACNRIEAARLVRRFPFVLDWLQDGRLNLTNLRLIGPHLGAEDREAVLVDASGKSRREMELLLARRCPKPLVPPSIRKLPEAKPAAAEPAPASKPPTPAGVAAPHLYPSRRAAVAPLTPDQYRVTFTARAETCEKLKRVQDLLRHQIPDGSPADIFDRALSALLEDLTRKKLGSPRGPRPSQGSALGSRHVPAEVKRAVWLRDGGRCAFVARDGRRSAERGFLEFHHLKPYAAGGEATTGNIALRCGPHNRHEARLFVDVAREGSGSVPERITSGPPRSPGP
jgi:hypothetical protein